MPYEPNINATHDYKHSKYQSLISDIESNGFIVEYYPIEIGARGYINKDNSIRLKKIHKSTGINTPYKQLQNNLSKLAIISSFVIFHAKTEPTLINPPPLKM